jgi:hypothetical protein
MDLDESDLTASKQIPERIKAYCDGHCSHDVEYSYHDNDHDDDDYHDDDYADDDDADHKIINRRPRKSVVPSSNFRRSSRISIFFSSKEKNHVSPC